MNLELKHRLEPSRRSYMMDALERQWNSATPKTLPRHGRWTFHAKNATSKQPLRSRLLPRQVLIHCSRQLVKGSLLIRLGIRAVERGGRRFQQLPRRIVLSPKIR